MDGPQAVTGLKRQVFNFNDISLTDTVIKIPRGVGHKALVKAFNKNDVLNKWNKTAWAKKLKARETRRNLNDFDRYKVMVSKRKRSLAVRTEANKLAKTSGKK